MYHNHFGLHKAPFKITPDTDLFYAGGERGDILEALVYAVGTGEGIVKVVGEVGSGKTMLCRMLELRLPAQIEIVYLANPSLKPEDILNAIAIEMDLDVTPTSNRLQVLHMVQQRLLKKHTENKQVVVFVEEAQGMPLATLEEIRLLSNLETQRDKLLQIVLFGQPELDKNLARKQIRQLRERIVHSFSLQPLTLETVRDYVHFRMDAAGYRGPEVFTKSAYRRMTRASAGLIRRVNILADKALLAAFADDTHIVTKNHLDIAVADSEFRRGMGTRLPELTLAAGLAGLLVAGVLAAKNVDLLTVLASLPQPTWLSVRATETEKRAVSATTLANVKPETAPASAPPPPATLATISPQPVRPPSQSKSVTPAQDTPTVVVRADTMAPAAVATNAALPPPTRLVQGSTTRTLHMSNTLSSRSVPAGVRASVELEAAPDAELQLPAVAATDLPADSPKKQQASNPKPNKAPGKVTHLVAAVVPELEAEPQVPPPVPPVTRAVMAVEKAPARVEPRPAWVERAPDANSLVARRLAATQSWLEVANRRHYSIQLLLTNAGKHRNLEAFLQKWQRAGEIRDVYVYPTVIGDKLWFGVLYNEYPTISAARDALKKLPDDLKRHRPFIRNVRDVG